MSDQSAANDAEIIADFRRTYNQLAKSDAQGHEGWSMRLTLEEMRALLAAVDERDALRREVCGDPRPPFPPVKVMTPEEQRASIERVYDGFFEDSSVVRVAREALDDRDGLIVTVRHGRCAICGVGIIRHEAEETWHHNEPVPLLVGHDPDHAARAIVNPA